MRSAVVTEVVRRVDPAPAQPAVDPPTAARPHQPGQQLRGNRHSGCRRGRRQGQGQLDGQRDGIVSVLRARAPRPEQVSQALLPRRRRKSRPGSRGGTRRAGGGDRHRDDVLAVESDRARALAEGERQLGVTHWAAPRLEVHCGLVVVAVTATNHRPQDVIRAVPLHVLDRALARVRDTPGVGLRADCSRHGGRIDALHHHELHVADSFEIVPGCGWSRRRRP
jgi:hypothetical protein